METELKSVSAVLADDEKLTSSSPQYVEESETWAAQKNLKPRLVARPKSLESLCKLVTALSQTSLNFAVRSGGVGSSSAKDVLISMTAFTGFEFDAENETATIGTGQSWGDVDAKIDKHCPGYATISTRSSFVGVGGSLTYGGLSWISSERGMAMAPGNLIDALVAIRGGGGDFCIVVEAKVRIFKYPQNIFAGRILYPRSSLGQVAKEVGKFAQRVKDPKMCLHLYCLSLEHYVEDDGSQGKAAGTIAIMFYDANGEEHGRSEEGFGWALHIPGAKEMTMNATYSQINQMSDGLKENMGVADAWMSAPLVPEITEDLVLRAWKWFDDLNQAQPSITTVPLGAFVLIELMQKAAIHTNEPRTDCAWPHTRGQHVLQLGVAAPKDRPEVGHYVLKALKDAGEQIHPGHNPGDYLPNFVQEFNDISKIYETNFPKLKELKKKYDPQGRLGGAFL